jgi:hypothetical protein
MCEGLSGCVADADETAFLEGMPGLVLSAEKRAAENLKLRLEGKKKKQKPWCGEFAHVDELTETHELALCDGRCYYGLGWGFPSGWGMPARVSMFFTGKLSDQVRDLAMDSKMDSKKTKTLSEWDTAVKDEKIAQVIPHLEERLMWCAGSKLMIGDGRDVDLTTPGALPYDSQLGRMEEVSEFQCCDPDGIPACCGIAPGWWSDFRYYTFNHHPVLGMCCYSSLSRLNCCLRFVMELSTFLFLWWLISKYEHCLIYGNTPWYAPFLSNYYLFYIFFSIVSFLVYDLLVALFTAPCCIVRPGDGKEKKYFYKVGSKCMACLGFTVSLSTSGFIIFWLVFWNAEGSQSEANHRYQARLEAAFWCRLIAYKLFFWRAFFREFNPCCAWGFPGADEDEEAWADQPCYYCCRSCFSVGRWRMEKQMFQSRCINALQYVRFKKKEEQITYFEQPPQPLLMMCMRPTVRNQGLAVAAPSELEDKPLLSSGFDVLKSGKIVG